MREELRPLIQDLAIDWAVGIISPARIDQTNILKASFEAMETAYKKLQIQPETLLVDGNRFRKQSIPYHCMIKGDGRFMNIAAASVLAKTYRDDIMRKLDEEFPMYNWKKNKGYPTVEHRDAIRLHGPVIHHRMSFQLLPIPTLF